MQCNYLANHMDELPCQAIVASSKVQELVLDFRALSPDNQETVKSLVDSTASASDVARQARSVFVETVLVLALTLGQRPNCVDKARALIREQLGRVASKEDGVLESDIQPVLLAHATKLLG